MHRTAFVVAFATLLILPGTNRAQERPILNPSEVIVLEPMPPEISCVEFLDLPRPIGPINWRDFPPDGLIDERPEPTGFPLAGGGVAGPQQYTYDEAGHLTMWTSASGDFENPMAAQTRTSYTYEDSGHLAVQIHQKWRDGAFLNDTRSVYSYSDSGQVSGIELSVWTAMGWRVSQEVDCRYDDAGRVTMKLGSTCPLTTDLNPVCEVTDSTTYFYDDLGRISEADGSARDVYRGWHRVRSRFEYDGTGKLVEEVNPTINPLDQGYRFEYAYDTAGRLSEQEIFHDFSKRRVRYSYQHSGDLTRTAVDNWAIGPDGWIEESETRYEYDARGTLKTVTRYPPDPDSWSQSAYRYDDRNRIVGEIRSSWTGIDWNPYLETLFEYDPSDLLLSYTENWDAWQQKGEFRVVYSYAVGTAISDDLPTERSTRLKQNYPNPVRTRTTIEYGLDRGAVVRLAIVDALGRTVTTLDTGHQPPGSHSIELDASNLPPGVYLYRLEIDGAIRTGRMVVTE